jgi:hypothetical protein
MEALDLPEEPGQPEHAEGSPDRPRPPEMPDPDERERAYEAVRAHVSPETRDQTEVGQQPDENDRRSYWDQVPRLLQMRKDYEERWPADQQPAPDHSADPPGSYRSHGGFYLRPDRHAEAVALIGRVRQAEPTISTDMQQVEQENAQGGYLDGFKFRLKEDDRLKEKLAERLEGQPDKTPTEILERIPDAIRYTFCVRPETYTTGYYGIKERLESLGYEMYESKNSWNRAEYKGINTRWVTMEEQRFEVQVHTPESFHAKHYVTHDSYERIHDPRTSDDERAELKAFQREVCSHIEAPGGAADIPDFKKDGL